MPVQQTETNGPYLRFVWCLSRFLPGRIGQKVNKSNIVHCTDAAWWQKLVSTHVSSSLLLVCAIGYSNSKSPNDNEGFGALVRQAEQNL